MPMLALLLLAGGTGCQVQVGGQTLPSPYYQSDDVQYFPPGPEFKLANEAAAIKAREQQAKIEALGPEAQRPGWTQPKWR
jgi:hypothetical protein